MVFSIVRSIGLLLSFYGYICFFRKKIECNLAIGFTFASIGSTMFFAGILNMLPEVAITLFCCGLILFLMTLKKSQIRLSVGGAYITSVGIIIFACVYGKVFLGYDNFSHWAIVVKQMLMANRFPNFKDPYIEFQSYPLGASAFIYYCVTITGISSEWFQMFVHAVCNLGMLSGLFCLARDIQSRLFCTICCTLLLSAVNAADTLYVDGMLAFTAICAFAFCIYYRDCLQEKGSFLLPWLVFLVSIKHSGLLLAFFIILWVLLFAEIKRNKWKLLSLLSLGTLLTAWLWRKHVKYAFVAGNASRHSISFGQFKTIFASKSADDLHMITTGYARNIFSFTNPYFPIFVFSVVVFVVLLLSSKQNSKIIRNMLLYGLICYLIYQLGLLGMFLFSMSRPEAIILQGFNRYHSTSWIFSTGVLVSSLMQMDDSRRTKLTSVFYLVCVTSILLSRKPSLNYFQTSSPDKSVVRQNCERIIDNNDIPTKKRYLIIVDQDHNDSGYLYYLIKYLLLPEKSQVVKVGDISDQTIMDDYDYLIAYGNSNEVEVFYEEYLPKTDKIIR